MAVDADGDAQVTEAEIGRHVNFNFNSQGQDRSQGREHVNQVAVLSCI